MFEDVVAALTRVDRGLSDADRVDRLRALEQVKAACAAAQARITADFAESQAEVAAAWRQRARECADDNDFEGWRAAREQARLATVDASEPGSHFGSVGRRHRSVPISVSPIGPGPA